MTWGILTNLSDKNETNWLVRKEIEKLPCPALVKIDKLWKKYSNNQFGLSVQKNIYENLGGKYNKFNLETYQNFASKVGWVKQNKTKYPFYDEQNYLFYEDLQFNKNEAPRGHLPAFTYTWISHDLSKGGFFTIAKRLNTCTD